MTDLMVTLSTDVALVDEVRAHYAEAARAVLDRKAGAASAATACCGHERGGHLRRGALRRARSRGLPDAAVLASLGCGNPDRGRRASRGRDRARPRLRRRDRRPALGPPGRPDRLRLRARHDRRDARAGARNAAEAGADERRVPEGRIEAIPLPGRLGRCRHQQLRHQPVDRQGRRLAPRSSASFGRAAGWASATSLPTTTCLPPNGPSAAASPAASPGRCRSPSIAPGSRPSGSSTSSRHADARGRATVSIAPSSVRPSRPAGRPPDPAGRLPAPERGLPVSADPSCGCGGTGC